MLWKVTSFSALSVILTSFIWWSIQVKPHPASLYIFIHPNSIQQPSTASSNFLFQAEDSPSLTSRYTWKKHIPHHITCHQEAERPLNIEQVKAWQFYLPVVYAHSQQNLQRIHLSSCKKLFWSFWKAVSQRLQKTTPASKITKSQDFVLEVIRI